MGIRTIVAYMPKVSDQRQKEMEQRLTTLRLSLRNSIGDRRMCENLKQLISVNEFIIKKLIARKQIVFIKTEEINDGRKLRWRQ